MWIKELGTYIPFKSLVSKSLFAISFFYKSKYSVHKQKQEHKIEENLNIVLNTNNKWNGKRRQETSEGLWAP